MEKSSFYSRFLISPFPAPPPPAGEGFSRLQGWVPRERGVLGPPVTPVFI